MKTYFADANLFIRITLKDNEEQVKRAKFYFLKAKLGQIKLVFIPVTILEIEYVLRKVYKIPRQRIAESLITLIKSAFIEVRESETLARSLKAYSLTKVDLVDAFLFFSAQKEGAEVLSFDKDFKAIAKAASSWN